MQALGEFLRGRRACGAAIYPPPEQMFAALNEVPPEKVRVVILGQDPYHKPGQAQGLCFSVNRGVRIPPSLRNIFLELHRDLGIDVPDHGCLKPWVKQGVLLLNTVLSVEHQKPGSHGKQGWEEFTDCVIKMLSEGDQPLVFMLWGAQAQRKGRGIDLTKHCVLSAAHPSPLSAYRGFHGCGHFGRANRFLLSRGAQPIDWSLACD